MTAAVRASRSTMSNTLQEPRNTSRRGLWDQTRSKKLWSAWGRRTARRWSSNAKSPAKSSASTLWENAKVIGKGEVLQVRDVEGRLHTTKGARRSSRTTATAQGSRSTMSDMSQAIVMPRVTRRSTSEDEGTHASSAASFARPSDPILSNLGKSPMSDKTLSKKILGNVYACGSASTWIARFR
jgi:hypothetical protein